MPDEKYVVFKRSEWDQFMGSLADALPAGHGIKDPDDLVDAVVIRTQDVFATSGLWAYAHIISTFIELDSNWDTRYEGKLKGVADYFAQRAMEAQRIMEMGKAKLPD